VTERCAIARLTSVTYPLSLDGPIVLLQGGPLVDRRLIFRNPVYASSEAIVRRFGDQTICCVVEVHDEHDRREFRPRVGSGLHAQITVSTFEDDGLTEFLRGLADDFRGWSGSRHWRSGNDQLRIEATHDGLGHVTLLFRLRDDLYPRGTQWDISIPFIVEAGAEMLALADAFEVFFAAATFDPGEAA
jgi:hypothetical protein